MVNALALVDFLKKEVGAATFDLKEDNPAIVKALTLAAKPVHSWLRQVNAPLADEMELWLAAHWFLFLVGESELVYIDPLDPTAEELKHQPLYDYSKKVKTFFANQSNFGMIVNTAATSTSVGITLPRWLENLSISDSWFLSTPYGANYVAFLQRYSFVGGLTR